MISLELIGKIYCWFDFYDLEFQILCYIVSKPVECQKLVLCPHLSLVNRVWHAAVMSCSTPGCSIYVIDMVLNIGYEASSKKTTKGLKSKKKSSCWSILCLCISSTCCSHIMLHSRMLYLYYWCGVNHWLWGIFERGNKRA